MRPKQTVLSYLQSPQNGTVITDNFIIGEQIEPGRVLFDISDESTLWIEARITPQANIQISEGMNARVTSQRLTLARRKSLSSTDIN